MVRGPDLLIPKSALVFILILLLLSTVGWLMMYLILLDRGWR
jgi:hypothetical protein